MVWSLLTQRMRTTSKINATTASSPGAHLTAPARRAACSNLTRAGSSRTCQYSSSDCDSQLIVKLQFVAPVSVRKIMVIGESDTNGDTGRLMTGYAGIGSHPRAVHCFTGR